MWGGSWEALHAAAEAGDLCLWASINLIVYEFRGICCGKITNVFFFKRKKKTDLFHYKPYVLLRADHIILSVKKKMF